MSVVVHVPGVPEAMGITDYIQALRSAVQDRLEQLGIPAREDARPTLSVSVTAAVNPDQPDAGPRALLIDTSVTQFVELAGGLGSIGKTWEWAS